MRLFMIPKIIQGMFSNIVWQIPNKSKQIFLTFDDGPNEIFTLQILKTLQKAKINGTFFILGENAKKSPAIVKQLKEHGHTIGIHSLTHQSLFYMSKNYIYTQLYESKKNVEQITGETVKYFRPPFGRFSPNVNKVCRQLDLQIVMWSLMSYDFDLNIADNYILELLETKTCSSDIIVFHDGHKNSGRTVNILQTAIKTLKDKGFQFNSISKD